MTNEVKISALPSNSAAALTDIIPASQGGTTYGETWQQVLTLFSIYLLNGGAAVYAATTGALNATYANGTSGIGATLTDASGTFAAFTTDGTTPPLNSRILIKNQGSTFQNGAYVLTTNGDTVSIPYVLTRASDYDTIQDINNTGIFPVINGTANANTGWYNTTVMVTIGSTAITFVKFGSVGVTSVATAGLANGGPITSTGTVTVTAAVKADQQTATSTTTAVTPAVQQYHPSACQAWVCATVSGGAATAAASYNITSMTNNSTGNYSANMTVPFTSTNYGLLASVNSNISYYIFITYRSTAGQMTINTATGTIASPTQADAPFSMSAFGVQ